MTGPWIQTFTGAKHRLLDPDPWDIRLADIAHALGKICRFTGHCVEHYSVAQHSVHVAELLRDQGHAEGVQRQGLMHDAHEAFVGDVASPIKWAMDGNAWETLERTHACAVRSRFGIPWDLASAVKSADVVLLLTEKRDLMGPPPEPWGIPGRPLWARITPWSAAQASARFLEWADRLGVV